MRISELVKRTGVPKETIHFYIRQGLLRKPRKSKVNSAVYNERHVNLIQLIKDLRDYYYLPIPQIKKIIKKFKKQSPSDQAVSQFHSRFFKPADRLFATAILGEDNFCRETGLGRKWLQKAQLWGLIEPNVLDNGDVVYAPDDVAVAKLMVDMDRLGFGPKDGHDPEDLRYIAEFVKKYVGDIFNKYYQENLEKLTSTEYDGKASQFNEVISLLFYHLYRKSAREATRRLLENQK